MGASQELTVRHLTMRLIATVCETFGHLQVPHGGQLEHSVSGLRMVLVADVRHLLVLFILVVGYFCNHMGHRFCELLVLLHEPR